MILVDRRKERIDNLARSAKKGPFVDLHLVKKVEAAQATEIKDHKTWSGDPQFCLNL